MHPLLPVLQVEAKLDMLRKMKEFKRGIHLLEWENRKCEMEVRQTGRQGRKVTLFVPASRSMLSHSIDMYT